MIRSKKTAAALALMVALIMFFSVLFIALEARHHDCAGEDCAVCDQIRACVNRIRNVAAAVALFAAAGFLCALVRVFAGRDCCCVDPRTLIALKVKLSD